MPWCFMCFSNIFLGKGKSYFSENSSSMKYLKSFYYVLKNCSPGSFNMLTTDVSYFTSDGQPILLSLSVPLSDYQWDWTCVNNDYNFSSVKYLFIFLPVFPSKSSLILKNINAFSFFAFASSLSFKVFLWFFFWCLENKISQQQNILAKKKNQSFPLWYLLFRNQRSKYCF